MTQIEKPKPALDAKIIVPFINATREVFKRMLSLETEICRPLLKTEAGPHYDVTGLIGFSGSLIGSAALSFEEPAAVSIVACFAGQKMESTSPDFADAVGELANMVAGRAKRDLAGDASITIPNVIIGKSYSIAALRAFPCLIVPCRTKAGDFAVQISIKQMAAVPNAGGSQT